MKKSFLMLLTLAALQLSATENSTDQITQAMPETLSNNNSKTSVEQNTQIRRAGNVYFYMDEAMSGKEYSDFLRVNCPAAYVKYHQGEGMTTAGWLIGGSGLALSVGALIGGMTMLNSGAIKGCIYGGAGLMAIGIPVLTIGYVKKHKSADVFNATCGSKDISENYWTINSSANGIGVALHF